MLCNDVKPEKKVKVFEEKPAALGVGDDVEASNSRKASRGCFLGFFRNRSVQEELQRFLRLRKAELVEEHIIVCDLTWKNYRRSVKKRSLMRMADEAEDINAQPWLIAKYKSDLKTCNLELPDEPKISTSAKPDEGKAKECLKEKLDKKVLEPECKKAVEDQAKI